MPRRLAATGVDQVSILSYEDAPLAADEVLVRTELAAGKHGTIAAALDHGALRGQRFDPDLRLFVDDPVAAEAGLPTPAAPMALGTTGVGVVTQVGEAATGFQPGDRVFGRMDLRETNVCKPDRLWLLGAADPLDALCVEPAFVVFHCLRESHVRYGDAVAVVGLGALGLLAVRMAVAAGAALVVAIDPLPLRRQLAQSYGADLVLDPTVGDVALEVHRATGGAGVDVAIELSGAYPALQTAVRCVRVGGTVCAAGFYQGEANKLWLGREFHHNRVTLIVPHGCGWGHPPRDYPLWDDQRAYDTLAHLIQQRRLTAPDLINHTIPFEQGTQILELIRSRASEVIKYAVRF